ncbi:hypothetical protein L227DRAFT_176763 [Lentinus tigrinus ALCF2SS1-6]|uniref:F-box domain-containing protein n=1 Tax=Lentinus tigrinus ALCF2SS1-6 TaxID=1328759 RepID=A0A5C2S696_9APHY|nr:hypothetical protein L227DRAFT_176763 [Lentinus tigrinus ALCF2SS1-6]
MQKSRLPLSVYEVVIDCVWEPLPWMDRHELVHWTSTHDARSTNPIHDLFACALTCTAWYPRACQNIYHTVVFRCSLDVELFVRSIRENPSLANLVRELIVNLRRGEYIPFTHHTLSGALRNVRAIVLKFPDLHIWGYPPNHHILVTQYHLTELVFEIDPSNKNLLCYAFRVVWSLHDLRSLSLSFYGGAPVSTPSIVNCLRSLRRSWSCENLKVLSIKEVMNILPSCPFGIAVEQLAVYADDPLSTYPIDDTKPRALVEQMSFLYSLQELHIWTASGGEREWGSITITLPLLLRALPSPDTLNSLHVVVNNDITSYRVLFLQSVAKSHLGGILQQFNNMPVLCFELTETDDGGRSTAWWEHQLRMSGIHHTIPMQAKIESFKSTPAWREDMPHRSNQNLLQTVH